MNSKVIVALDYETEREALNFVDQVDPSLCRLKVGKEMFTSLGINFVKQLQNRKVDLHASGGLAMMEQARKILEPYGKDAPLLIAVTVLTSMEDLDLLQIGINASPMEQVIRLAHLAQRAGCDGVVCSPKEVEVLRTHCGKDFKLVTPGIRPAGSDFGDQRRVMTPRLAIETGSDYLVIGRPITQAEDPLAALKAINASIEA